MADAPTKPLVGRVTGRLGRERDRRVEWLRERLELEEEKRLLQLARGGTDVCWSDDDAEPLVTVRIATYNRGQMVVDRAIASAVQQTYERLEILVIGDKCDGPTERAIRSVTDPRLRFVNLPTRGVYPSTPRAQRAVAGSHPMNAGLVLARGSWIAPCDDDDELTTDHVEVLLAAAKRQRLEMVHSKARYEHDAGKWDIVGSEPLRQGHVSHGSVLYSLGLRFLRHSNTSWKLAEPSDWNLWRRMRAIGTRIGFCDAVTYVHYIGATKR